MAGKSTGPTPEPIPQIVVCSVCGLDWRRHEKATLEECVRLLKAELASRPQWRLNQGFMGSNVYSLPAHVTAGPATVVNPPPADPDTPKAVND